MRLAHYCVTMARPPMQMDAVQAKHIRKWDLIRNTHLRVARRAVAIVSHRSRLIDLTRVVKCAMKNTHRKMCVFLLNKS